MPEVVTESSAAKQRARSGDVLISASLVAAEDAADKAVETATTADTLRRSLRDTPGAHKDFLYAIGTPNAHTANTSDGDLSEVLDQTNQRERTSE